MSSVLNSKLKSISFRKSLMIVVTLYFISLTLEMIYARSPLTDRWSGSVFIVDNKGVMQPIDVKMRFTLFDAYNKREVRDGNRAFVSTGVGYRIQFKGKEQDKLLAYGFDQGSMSTSYGFSGEGGGCRGGYRLGYRFLRNTPDFIPSLQTVLDVHGYKECKNFQLQPDDSSTLFFQGGEDFRIMAELKREWDINILQRIIMYFKWDNLMEENRTRYARENGTIRYRN